MYDVIVIGAGAAGLVAAGVAARAGRKVLVIEKMEKAARKVRITGRGRCNVTNSKPREEFLTHVRSNAEFFASSFKRLDNQAMPLFFKRLGVKLVEERGDRLFPESGRAWDVADALADWAKDEGECELMFNTTVTDIIVTAGKVRGVKVLTKKGYPRNIEAERVIIATGGVSYPSTGSTGDGYRFAHAAGHRIEEVRPSLVALESPVAEGLRGTGLKNVGLKLLIDSEVAQEEFGEMEFSNRGLDGAVILRVSRRAVDALIDERQVEIEIDLKPALDEAMIIARIDREIEGMEGASTAFAPSSVVSNNVSAVADTANQDDASTPPAEGDASGAEPDADAARYRSPRNTSYGSSSNPTNGELMRKLLPRPLVEIFADKAGIMLREGVSRLTDAQKQALAAALKSWRLPVVDYRPFTEAIVTAGGVSVDEIDPLTLQSHLVRGLYFAGEVLDIDGDTGGYNLQIAFSTGYNAGQAVVAATAE